MMADWMTVNESRIRQTGKRMSRTEHVTTSEQTSEPDLLIVIGDFDVIDFFLVDTPDSFLD